MVNNEKHSPDQISKDDVQLYMDYLEEQQRNAGTIEKYLAAISVSRFLGNRKLFQVSNVKKKLKKVNT